MRERGDDTRPSAYRRGIKADPHEGQSESDQYQDLGIAGCADIARRFTLGKNRKSIEVDPGLYKKFRFFPTVKDIVEGLKNKHRTLH